MEQRIGNTLRQGRVDDNRMEYYVEAVKDPSTGLTFTYPALTGVRKRKECVSVSSPYKMLSAYLVEE